MCNFLSAIVGRTGEVYCNPLLDSHEDIVDYFNLRDGLTRNIVRVEFSPKDKKNMLDVNKYELMVDEDCPPKWFEEYKEKTIEYLTEIIKRITITDDRKILVGGAYLLSSNIIIGRIVSCNIEYAGSSTIKNAGSSTIKNAGYSTIEDAGYSTIEGKKHKNGKLLN